MGRRQALRHPPPRPEAAPDANPDMRPSNRCGPADRERIAGSRAPLMGPPRPLGIAFNSLIREVNGVECLPTCWNEFAITHSSWIVDQADAADCAADLSAWLAEMVDQ